MKSIFYSQINEAGEKEKLRDFVLVKLMKCLSSKTKTICRKLLRDVRPDEGYIICNCDHQRPRVLAQLIYAFLHKIIPKISLAL